MSCPAPLLIRLYLSLNITNLSPAVAGFPNHHANFPRLLHPRSLHGSAPNPPIYQSVCGTRSAGQTLSIDDRKTPEPSVAMKPIHYYLNFPLARQIQDCLDRLSPDQKIELAFAIGQRALDEKRSADVVHRDIEGIPPVEMSIEDDDNYPDFLTSPAHHKGATA